MTSLNSSNTSPLASIWFWVIGILICFLGGLAFALWSSYDNRFEQNAEVIEKIQQDAIAAERPVVNNQNGESVDPSLPVPAKKLQTLLNDNDNLTDDDLEKRMAALDQQLKALDEELKAQGVDVPKFDASDIAADESIGDTEARLNAIKEFMAKKEKPPALAE